MRFCLACGVGRGLYAPGSHLTIRSRPHVLCRGCGVLRDYVGAPGMCGECAPRGKWSQRISSENPICGSEDDEWMHAEKWSCDGEHSQELYGIWPEI